MLSFARDDAATGLSGNACQSSLSPPQHSKPCSWGTCKVPIEGWVKGEIPQNREKWKGLSPSDTGRHDAGLRCMWKPSFSKLPIIIKWKEAGDDFPPI